MPKIKSVYNTYRHSIALPVNGALIAEASGDTPAQYEVTHVNLMAGATLELKTHVLHATALRRWPKLALVKDEAEEAQPVATKKPKTNQT